MTAWQQLIQQGILGTGRQPTFPELPSAIVAQIAHGEKATHSRGAEDSETHFLRQAAMLAQYEAAGALPLALDENSGLCAINAAPAETMTPVNAGATDLLHQLLQDLDIKLIIEWLGYATRNRQYLPHATLPDLLDLATKQRALAAALAPVLGERGRWLLALNPAWQQSIDDPLANDQWRLGNAKARQSYLETLRRHEPAKARTLLTEVWSQEAAGERAGFVATLRTNLSQDDLPFLQEALGDRSLNVRITAGRLLAALPHAALHQTLIAELGRHLQIERKWLKRQLTVKLPNYFREEWHEWGIREQSPLGVRIGQKMGWLTQLIALIPPSSLVDALAVDAVDLLELIRGTDHAEALLTALLEGAEQHQDFAFLLTELNHLLRLLKLAQSSQSEFIDRFGRYAPILPTGERARIVQDYLTITKASAFGDWSTLQMVVRHFDTLPQALTDRLLTEQIPALLARNTRDYGIGRILIDMAYQFAPESYTKASTLLRSRPGEERPDYLDRFLQIYALRHQMAETFNR